MVWPLLALSHHFLRLGFHQDIQKEGKTCQEDQAEQTYAKLDQIQDWQQNQVQR